MRPIVYELREKLNIQNLDDYTKLSNLALFEQVKQQEEEGIPVEFNLKDAMDTDTALAIVFNSDFFDQYPEEEVRAYLDSDIRTGIAEALVRYSELTSTLDLEDVTIEA